MRTRRDTPEHHERGLHAPKRTLETARVVVEVPDGVLLLRRSAAPPGYAGPWERPGGKGAPGGDAAWGALREVYEETGIRLERAQLEPLGHLTHEDEQRVI